MDHHVKQAPVQGVTGLWGGTQGALTSGGAADPVYVDDVFSTYLYKGTGGSNTVNNGLDISGEGGLVWVKNRSSTRNSMLFDTVRGANYEIATQSTSDSNNNTALNQTFTSTGFTFNNSNADANDSSDNYASWSFRKTEKFFDVVQFSGSGAEGKVINHSLGCRPGMIMMKRTDNTSDWHVWHNELTQYNDMRLNSSAAMSNNYIFGAHSDMTSTSFKIAVGGNSLNYVNQSGSTWIAYVFGGGLSDSYLARSVDFDGTGDKLSLASHADLQIGSSTYTLEFWVYKNADTPDDYDVWASKGSNSSNTREFAIESMADQTMDWYYAPSSGSSWSVVENVSRGKIPNGQWVHICAQKDSSGYFSFFVNGTRTYYSTTGGQTLNTGADAFCIGGFADASTALESNVKISNFRFVKGTALYTTSFKPSTEPLTNITNTKLLCCNNGSNDQSVVGYTVKPSGSFSASGNPSLSTDSPFDDPANFAFGEDGDENIIKMGSYKGNGSATAPPVVYLGWEPQWVMVKHLTGQDWVMVDNMRGMFVGSNAHHLRANSNNAEQDQSYYRVDVSSAIGFAPHTTDNGLNADGSDYIYMALRRPDGYVGKPADAATDVFALDTGNSATAASETPTYDSGFPVDWGMRRIPSGGGGLDANFIFYERLLDLNYLQSTNTSAQATSSRAKWDLMTGFNHTDSSSYNAWMWKRHIGLDVVAFEGTNNAGLQVPHSLNAVPEMMILRNRDATENWAVYHKGLNGGTNPQDYAIRLNSTAAEIDSDGFWNDTAPTATAFTLGNNGETNGFEMSMLAILFTSVTGISKVGSYTGDDSDDGSYEINVGFSPRFLVIKRADNTTDWKVFNTLTGFPTSGAAAFMEFNTTDDAYSGATATVTRSTNGFKLYSPGSPYNAGSAKYVYYAHA